VTTDPAAVPAAPVASAAPAALPTAANQPQKFVDDNVNMLAGLNDDQPKRKRGPWLVIGILGAVLVVGLGITLWLQSSGTIYSGIFQRLVGGFPKSADQALVLMRQNLPTSYGIDGQVSLVKSSQLPSIGEEEATQTTAEISGSVQGSLTDGNWQASFNLQLANDYPITNLQGEGIRVDAKRYIFLDTLSLLVADNNWQEITEADWTGTVISTPFSALELSSILGRASAGQYLGQNTLQVAGQSYNVSVYQYTVDQAADYKDATYEEGRLLVWVNRKTGEVVEYQLDERLQTASSEDVVFQSVWQINSAATVTEIALPEGETAINGSVSQIGLELGFIAVPTGEQDLATSAGRDVKRLADLLSVKEALQAYYQQTGKYPVASVLDKTNDSRVLSPSLVPTYIDGLPVDPQDPQAYYGYTSDGFSFKLTSIVEESTSTGAKQGSGFFYQEVTN